jgi:hypothetical protein
MCGWRNRSGLWPGRGQFSYLPPWERPGWSFGRGGCWRHWHLAAPFPYNATAPTSKEELEALEAYKSELGEELKSTEARIKELRETKE